MQRRLFLFKVGKDRITCKNFYSKKVTTMQLKFCDQLLEKSALKKYRFNNFSNLERFHNSFYHFRFRKNIVN